MGVLLMADNDQFTIETHFNLKLQKKKNPRKIEKLIYRTFFFVFKKIKN